MLLGELRRRGYGVVEEPGRRIVNEELEEGGSALPWVDMTAFLRRAAEVALLDRTRADGVAGWVFFDRCLVDAVAGLEEITGEPLLASLAQGIRYHHRVFLVPPWPEIYVRDPERRHDIDAALVEYSRLLRAFSSLEYEISVIPKIGVSERADFVLDILYG